MEAPTRLEAKVLVIGGERNSTKGGDPSNTHLLHRGV